MSENYNENARFRRADTRLLVALASGESIRRAARTARVSQQTVSRRLEDADFRRRLARLRARMVDEAIGQLSRGMARAGRTLRRLLTTAQSESVRLGAARTILEMHCRLKEAGEIEERLQALEERLAASKVNTNGRDYASSRN